MEARLTRTALLAAALMVTMGARFQSANFIVDTSDPQMAEQISKTAEQFRHDLAIEWLGEAMPNWAQPCMMTVQVAPNLGAGGATTFVFDHGEVFGWRMNIQGSAQRVLDSVLPHEITHMIFASHFRRPLPRWADEGGATSVEHISEKQKHRTMLVQFLHTGRGIAFSQMFAMTEYPPDVMPLYAQGYSLSEFLIYQGGRRRFVEFLGEGMRDNQWSAAIERNYKITDLGSLQNTWVNWVAQGFPAPSDEVLAANARQSIPVTPVSTETASADLARRTRPDSNLIFHVRDKEPAASGPENVDSAKPPFPSQPAAAAYAPQAATDQLVPASGVHMAGQPVSTVGENATVSPPGSQPASDGSRKTLIEWNQK